ncbi:MAG: cell division protein FtsZ [Verrucomicrobia bacterium]|nr:MAG: cell division protein FtsZ [Verrucomicrobiota bacterium]
MIELTRTHEAHSEWKVKVVGVGGAGTHAADRLTRDGLVAVEILAANTDARSLAGAATTDRIVLGHSLTRGLGAGGDPELGRAAALESLAAVGERLAGASLVVLLAGLGGGTGSGATPCIAQIARAQGAHVAVFATLPFTFEGRRRREQALEALDALREHADFVVCFENDRMPSVADPASGIEDAFASVDSLLSQAVRSITEMTRRRNVMHSGIDEIASTVAGPRSTALFGYGVADGEERARAAVARAFDSPLLDADGSLRAVSRLWVYVAGGSDMRWSEVQTLMGEISERVSPEVRLFFGAAVDASMEGSISVTLLAGVPGAEAGVRSEPAVERAPVTAYRPAPGFVSAPVPVLPPADVQKEHAVSAAVVTQASPDGQSPVAVPRHEPFGSWQDIPPLAPASEPAHESGSAVAASFGDEPALLALDAISQAAPVQAWSAPTPPFELSKERRREAAAQEAALQEAAAPHVSRADEIAFMPAAPAQEEVPGSIAFEEPPPAPLSPFSNAGSAEVDGSAFDPTPAASEFTPASELELEPALPLGMPRENGKRTKDGVQEQMRFETPNRGGRFEKTDPTIVDGEDLDVPTFMRQRLPIE